MEFEGSLKSSVIVAIGGTSVGTYRLFGVQEQIALAESG